MKKKGLFYTTFLIVCFAKNTSIQFLTRVFLILTVFIFVSESGISQERDALNLVMSDNDKATTEDIIVATQKTSKETQEKIQEGMAFWKKLDTDFSYLKPTHPLRQMIDKVNATGFKDIVGDYQKRFKSFDSGLSKLLDKKEKLDKIIHFYEMIRT